MCDSFKDPEIAISAIGFQIEKKRSAFKQPDLWM